MVKEKDIDWPTVRDLPPFRLMHGTTSMTLKRITLNPCFVSPQIKQFSAIYFCNKAINNFAMAMQPTTQRLQSI